MSQFAHQLVKRWNIHNIPERKLNPKLRPRYSYERIEHDKFKEIKQKQECYDHQIPNTELKMHNKIKLKKLLSNSKANDSFHSNSGDKRFSQSIEPIDLLKKNSQTFQAQQIIKNSTISKATDNKMSNSKKMINTSNTSNKMNTSNNTNKSNKLTETASTSNQQSRKVLPPKFIRQEPKLNKIVINDKSFIILRALGEGKSGRVLLVIEQQCGMVMAMKIVPKDRIKEQRLLEQLIRQLKIQAFLNHPNIIQFYGFYDDDYNFYILMELGSDGQLYRHMENGRKMSEESTSYIIRGLLSATEYLHSHNIIHRDIKPENIVVVHGNIKLCDFGWSVILEENLRTTYCGTPLYFSPQIIVGRDYDEKVDIWAIGVLTYELMIGTTPFGIKQKDELYKIVTQDVIFNETKPNKYSIYFKEFVKAILRKDPRQRMSCKKLLSMPFIRRYNELQTCQELCRWAK